MSETVTAAELERVKSVLTSEYGVVFYPKRSLEIPIIEKEQIVSVVGEKEHERARNLLDQAVIGYLDGQPIGDRFGTDPLKERERWRIKMYQEFGEAFSIVYTNRNQFKQGFMGAVHGALNIFEHMAQKNGNQIASGNFTALKQAVYSVVNGGETNIPNPHTQLLPYPGLKTDAERIEAVHFVEDRCLDTLRIFSNSK